MEKVRARLLKLVGALEKAHIPYAIAGGNAVAAWVSTVDEAAVRNTRGVDVLVRHQDLESIKDVLARQGLVCRHIAGLDVLLDSAEANVRDSVHLVFADEKVRDHDPESNPSIDE